VRDQVLQLLNDEMQWTGPFLMRPVLPETREPIEKNDPADELERIRHSLGNCTSCQLASTKKNLVFGEGSQKADLMFIGEAPGAVEDETGRPFVGPAGSLLTNIISAMGLKREDVYIANILKCRPPGNRDPQPDEIEACIGCLEAQIQTINPRVIVLLGRIAAHTLLNSTTPISRLRGTFQSYKGFMTMPTYHPSYLLQNPSKKRDVWEDIKKVMDYIGLPLSR
jgi:uracil-DNA glycosylase